LGLLRGARGVPIAVLAFDLGIGRIGEVDVRRVAFAHGALGGSLLGFHSVADVARYSRDAHGSVLQVRGEGLALTERGRCSVELRVRDYAASSRSVSRTVSQSFGAMT